MFTNVQPDEFLVRTRVRLDRHGATPAVIAANAFDWASLSLHQSLLPILSITLGVAVLGRFGLTLLQIALLLPLAHLLVVRPTLRSVRQMRHQLHWHRLRDRSWKRDQA